MAQLHFPTGTVYNDLLSCHLQPEHPFSLKSTQVEQVKSQV